jgi:RimJ/RimL family protein N-acetyltransferase
MLKDFTVRPLQISDALALSTLLCSQAQSYIRFFTPFNFDEATITQLLAQCERDAWMGIYLSETLLGFFMLRGWDAGFEVPAYGVLVDEQYSGYGLARLSLRYAKSLCKLRRAPHVMLKVHPENLAARKLFEAARFRQTGIEAASGNLIYHFDFNEQGKKF